MFKKEYKPVFRQTLKQKQPKTFRKSLNSKTLRNLAIAFAVVIVAAFLYLRFLQPHTLEAKQKVQLESTVHQLQQTKQQLEQTQTQSQQEKDAQTKQIEELNKQIQQKDAELQAKRSIPSIPRAYAAAPTIKPSGTCAEWMAQAGIPNIEATNKLIINESGCNPNAVNRSSGACGIPQALPCSKLTNVCPTMEPVCQLRWMDNYVKDRYGTWNGALAAWYSRCGSPQGCWY